MSGEGGEDKGVPGEYSLFEVYQIFVIMLIYSRNKIDGLTLLESFSKAHNSTEKRKAPTTPDIGL